VERIGLRWYGTRAMDLSPRAEHLELWWGGASSMHCVNSLVIVRRRFKVSCRDIVLCCMALVVKLGDPGQVAIDGPIK
jgi:hypothetical protein